MAKRKTFDQNQLVEVKNSTRGEWFCAKYHHAVDMPPLWLGPGLHVVRLPDGTLKKFTASRIRAV